MRTFVSLDTETGIIRRYSETPACTHVAGLVSDPRDAIRTSTLIHGFRVHPSDEFRVPAKGLRTYDDALREQIQRRELRASHPLLLTHMDEA